MTVRYMIVTDNRDGTTTHAVVATLAEARAFVRSGIDPHDADSRELYADVRALDESGGVIVLPDDVTVTVTPVVWRGRCYVRADVSAIEQPDNLPLDSGKASV